MIDNSTLLTILMGFSEWCSCFAYGDWAARSTATPILPPGEARPRFRSRRSSKSSQRDRSRLKG
jgi:hypothetical protein